MSVDFKKTGKRPAKGVKHGTGHDKKDVLRIMVEYAYLPYAVIRVFSMSGVCMIGYVLGSTRPMTKIGYVVPWCAAALRFTRLQCTCMHVTHVHTSEI